MPRSFASSPTTASCSIRLFCRGGNLHKTWNVLPPHKGEIDEARRQQIALIACRPDCQSWRPYARSRTKLVETVGQPSPRRRQHRPTVSRWLRSAPGRSLPSADASARASRESVMPCYESRTVVAHVSNRHSYTPNRSH
jgi:hypothetical protein